METTLRTLWYYRYEPQVEGVWLTIEDPRIHNAEQSHVKLKDLSNQSAPMLITNSSLGNTKEPMKLADQVAQDQRTT